MYWLQNKTLVKVLMLVCLVKAFSMLYVYGVSISTLYSLSIFLSTVHSAYECHFIWSGWL